MGDKNIKVETTSSYDQTKYESLGVVTAAMSVTVSFGDTAPPKPSGFFGSSKKAAPPVDKQQKLTLTENQMILALKKQVVLNAPEGTERLVDFKVSPPENIAHPPEYILSVLVSATAIKKIAGPNNSKNRNLSVQSQPVVQAAAPVSQAVVQAAVAQPVAQAPAPQAVVQAPIAQPAAVPVAQPTQAGGKGKARKARKTRQKKKSHHKRSRKHRR
jgi:hypothetical protein